MSETRQEVLDIPEFSATQARFLGQKVIEDVFEGPAEQIEHQRHVVDVAFNGTTSIVIGRRLDASGQPLRGSIPYISFEERLF